VRSGGALAVTSVDAVLEGVHFRLGEGFLTPAQVGHRALAAALSDLAAMGARSGEAYVALGLPEGFGEDAALELMRALDALAQRTGTELAGGDVVAAPALSVTITAVGWADAVEQLVLRSGARAGDLVGVTGALGAAGAALAVMERGLERSQAARGVLAGALAPLPRLAQGRALAAAGVHAMIDLSDGLAGDAMRIAEQSGVQIEIELLQLPLQGGVRDVCRELGEDPWRLAATGGEDYELLFCCPPALREQAERALEQAGDLRLSWVGRVLGEGRPALRFVDERGEVLALGSGYEHRF